MSETQNSIVIRFAHGLKTKYGMACAMINAFATAQLMLRGAV